MRAWDGLKNGKELSFTVVKQRSSIRSRVPGWEGWLPHTRALWRYTWWFVVSVPSLKEVTLGTSWCGCVLFGWWQQILSDFVAPLWSHDSGHLWRWHIQSLQLRMGKVWKVSLLCWWPLMLCFLCRIPWPSCSEDENFRRAIFSVWVATRHLREGRSWLEKLIAKKKLFLCRGDDIEINAGDKRMAKNCRVIALKQNS